MYSHVSKNVMYIQFVRKVLKTIKLWSSVGALFCCDTDEVNWCPSRCSCGPCYYLLPPLMTKPCTG